MIARACQRSETVTGRNSRQIMVLRLAEDLFASKTGTRRWSTDKDLVTAPWRKLFAGGVYAARTMRGNRRTESHGRPTSELARDPEMAAAIVNRAIRRLAGAAAELDPPQRAAARHQIACLQSQLGRLAAESHRSKSPTLSETQRTTILELHPQGVSLREIARLPSVSRPAVRKVLRSKTAQIPESHRSEKATPHRSRILELFSARKRNLVRVRHSELTAA